MVGCALNGHKLVKPGSINGWLGQREKKLVEEKQSKNKTCAHICVHTHARNFSNQPERGRYIGDCNTVGDVGW